MTAEWNRLDEDRRQLREDEAALEKYQREMEVSMARERALLARQETELKRLSAEVQDKLGEQINYPVLRFRLRNAAKMHEANQEQNKPEAE